MVVYGEVVIGLNFMVDLCLLLGANRLSGRGFGWKRVLPAAALGSVYAAVCLLPGFLFLGNFLWRFVVLALMSVIAFGANQSGLRRGILFVFLSMALGGIALGIGKSGFWGIVASAAAICILCFAGFRGPVGQQRYVDVTLHYRGKEMKVTALLDTGNMLRDPLSGRPVLLVGADVGLGLAGFTEQQLADPLAMVASGHYPGARLIPYRAVGRGCGMLLALNMDAVWIDGEKAGKLVAFAPNVLSRGKSYQALTGGVL